MTQKIVPPEELIAQAERVEAARITSYNVCYTKLLRVSPKILVQPRFQSQPEDLQKLKEIAGYMFYVEGVCSPPALMLLKIGKTDITSTIAKIDEIPDALVREAISSPVNPPVHGMYEITDNIKEWLRKELGI